MSDDLSGVVRAGVPTVDDCPVLTRMRAFIVDQGVESTLEHVVLNRAGNPVNLTPLFGGADSSISDSEQTGKIVLRVKEALGRGTNPSRNPIWEVAGVCLTPETGTVRADIDSKIVARSGVYQLSWGVQNLAGKVVLVNNSILSVERSLFADVGELERDRGPLTIQSLRVYLRDSHPNENMRLDNLEFGDEEILNAILRPVEYYNEQPPPIGHCTTRDFPSRYQWSQATISVLYEMAAHWYRRNKQQISAGGMSDDDLNRDQAYDGKAQALWADFKDWVIRDKVMRNAKLVVGQVNSVYGGGFNSRW